MASRSLLKKSPARFLELGMGAGRHRKLAMEVGFEAFGLDISLAGWAPETIGVVSKTAAGKREFMTPRDGAKEILRARCRRDGRNP